MPLPDFIRQRRTFLDLSRSEAARRAGLSRRTWCDVEDGVRPNAALTTLSQIEQVLQLPEGTLYAMTGHSGNRQLEKIRQKALTTGAVAAEVVDARALFMDSFVLPALMADALYEGKYPLATARRR